MKSEERRVYNRNVKPIVPQVRPMVKRLYRERTERLRLVRLDEIVASISDGYWLFDSESADRIVTALIEKYLSRFEAWWQDFTRDPELALRAFQLRRDFPQRFIYEKELANARNRLTLAFINQYCTAEYAIDRRKLIVFNQGEK